MDFEELIQKEVVEYHIKKGTTLYRFVNGVSPNDVDFCHMQNKGSKGRFNGMTDIYYCTNDKRNLSFEFKKDSIGSIIVSTVTSDNLCVGQIVKGELFQMLYGLTREELEEADKLNLHLRNHLNLNKIVDNEKTSQIAIFILKKYSDGIAFPSVYGFPNGITVGNRSFCISDDNKLCADKYALNFALTSTGLKKINEHTKDSYCIP